MTKSAVALSLLAVACRSGAGTTTVPPDGGAHLDAGFTGLGMAAESHDYYSLYPRRELDLLFVVENTPGMAAKQQELARVLPLLFGELDQLEGGRPDLHVAVVTSDLGAGAVPGNDCGPVGDGAEFVTRDCAAIWGPERFLHSSLASTMNNFQGDLATAVGCLVRAGESGCAFPSPLQTGRAALYEDIIPANKGFLRSDAKLAVVFVADRDDCSAPTRGSFYTSGAAGQSPALRCALAGHRCNGAAPTGEGFEAPLASCTATADKMLISVQEAVESIKALKKRPEDLRVAALMAPLDGPGAVYRVGRDATGAVGPLALCQTALGEARADLRLADAIARFDEAGRVFDLCSADLSAPVQALGAWLRSAFPAGVCVGKRPADADPTSAGVQPACTLTLIPPSSSGQVAHAASRCQDGGPRPCFDLFEDSTCTESGWRVRVDQAGTGADELFAVTCLVAGDPGVAAGPGPCSGPGCQPAKALGQLCGSDSKPDWSVAAFRSDAPPCPSGLCLRPATDYTASVPPSTQATCSRACEVDADCADAELRQKGDSNDGRCVAGYTCAVPFEVGPLCCRKLCVCKDFLDGVSPAAASCAPGLPATASACSNRQ
jgi:hypothetical protein